MNHFLSKLKAFHIKNLLLFFIFLLIVVGICSASLIINQLNAPKRQHGADLNNVFVVPHVDEPEKTIPAVIHYKSIPVLIYHYVKDSKSNNDLNMPIAKFKLEMKYIKDNYTPLTLDELYNHFENGSPVPDKPVVITFDDGDKDLFTNAYPVLKEYNIKATIFMITGFIDKHPDYLTSKQLVEMQKSGVDIESHTAHHEKLDTLKYDLQYSTLKDSKDALEKLLHKEVKYIAYPYGAYNDDTIEACKKTGYKMAFTGVRGLADKTNGIYELHRIYIGKMDGMKLFKKVLSGDLSLK